MYNNFERNIRHYPKPSTYKPIILPASMPRDGWESIDSPTEKLREATAAIEDVPKQSQGRNERLQWPDGGMNIVPTEDQPKQATRKIHSIGFDEDPTDDQNNWGAGDTIETPEKIVQNTDGVYRLERDAKYYYNTFTEDTPKFTWLVPGIIAGGGHPIYFMQEDNLDYLRDAGFGAIVSCFEEPLPKEWLNDFEYLFLPTLDGYVNNLIEACEFIEKMEQKKVPIFIHCFAGHGRTGTILAAYLLYKNYLTADEAIAYVRQKYDKRAIETIYQQNELYKLTFRL